MEAKEQPCVVCSLPRHSQGPEDGTLAAKLAQQVLLLIAIFARPGFVLKPAFWNWGFSSVVQHLLNKCKALSLVLSLKQI